MDFYPGFMTPKDLVLTLNARLSLGLCQEPSKL